MEFGVMYATTKMIGALIMLELYVVSWDFHQLVRISFCAPTVCVSINSFTGAYPVPTNVFGPGSEHVVLGDVHCIGTESGLLECSHNSIGDHICGFYAFYYGKSEHHFDVAISCYGK